MEPIDGMEYALWEVDQELIALTPQLKRKMYRGEVIDQIDALLDTRNYLVSIAAELAIDEYERLMT